MGMVRRRKTAQERREQLRAFAELASHRGGQLSRVAAGFQASLASHAEIPGQEQQMEHRVTDVAPSVAMHGLGWHRVLGGFPALGEAGRGHPVRCLGRQEELTANASVSIGKNEGEVERPRRRRKKPKLKVDGDDDA